MKKESIEWEKIKDNWMDTNCSKSTFIGTHIIPAIPDIGHVMNINGIQIPQNIFPEEYNSIVTNYFSVIQKLEEHYKKVRNIS